MFLFISIFLGTLASGFFWTGFPLFFHESQDQNISLSSIYVFATFGSLVFSLVGGYLSDIVDFRKIAALSNLLSFVFVAFIFLLMSFMNEFTSNFFVLLFLPLLYFNFALGETSESVWILKSAGQEHLRNRFFDRVILSFSAKLIGFFLGPILFVKLHQHALVICFSLFFLVSGIQIILVLKEKNLALMTRLDSNSVKKISLRNLSLLIKTPSLLTTTILTGLLSVPFNVIIVNYLIEIGRAIDISIFWGFGGFAAISGIFILKKVKFQNPKKMALPISLGLIFFLDICFLTKNSVLVILAASSYIFLGTFFTLQVRLQLLEDTDFEIIGSSAGVLNCLIDTGVFLGMLLIGLPSLQHHVFVVVILSLLLLLRYLSFVGRVFKRTSILAIKNIL